MALPSRSYDYLLKFLLVGDSDVGKEEILNLLEDGEDEVYASHSGVKYKTITILLEGKWVKLQLWDTFGQGRFSTIIRSYSRGAQGILLVYDITNRWSFSGIDRWIKEINEQVPGIPKILIGNRLHLEFRRAVPRSTAEAYAAKNNMEYFEVSPLAEFNISESLTELSRLVVNRNGMHRILKPTTVNSLQDICCRCIVRHMKTVYGIDHLPVPQSLRLQLRSFANSELLSASNTLSLRRHVRSPSDSFSSPMSSANLRLANSENIVKIKRLMSMCGVNSSSGRSSRGSYNVNTADTDGPSSRITSGRWHSADPAVEPNSLNFVDRMRRRRSQQHSSGQPPEDAESSGRNCKIM